jgi:hypothetical protein
MSLAQQEPGHVELSEVPEVFLRSLRGHAIDGIWPGPYVSRLRR